MAITIQKNPRNTKTFYINLKSGLADQYSNICAAYYLHKKYPDYKIYLDIF